MIHWTPEGTHVKIGLNFRISRGGFGLLWAWYNFTRREAITYRFRLRVHMKPRLIWEIKRWNVIDHFLEIRDLAIVNRELFEDMAKSEEDIKRINCRYALVRPELHSK
jgi:hypothetical protein